MTREIIRPEFTFPFPVSESETDSDFSTVDVRPEFEALTKQTPRDLAAEQAFIASKLNLLQSHPRFNVTERETLITKFENEFKIKQPEKSTPPVPGGVGYGMFYNKSFKTNFATGTSIYWQIICPNPPGGNVSDYLYLTATNRTAKGVEAFISYYGQNKTYFKVFDWARSDHWQTNIPFSSLSNYLGNESANGRSYPVLTLINTTSESSTNYWYNQVWLWNYAHSRWDLIYQYKYSSTQTEQKSDWVGSWGPIVETFQDSYNNTNPMGALNTQLISRDDKNCWGSWKFLNRTDSYFRDDHKGFNLVFIDPNYNWAVNS